MRSRRGFVDFRACELHAHQAVQRNGAVSGLHHEAPMKGGGDTHLERAAKALGRHWLWHPFTARVHVGNDLANQLLDAVQGSAPGRCQPRERRELRAKPDVLVVFVRPRYSVRVLVRGAAHFLLHLRPYTSVAHRRFFFLFFLCGESRCSAVVASCASAASPTPFSWLTRLSTASSN